MERIWLIPVLASILILVTLGLSQEVEANHGQAPTSCGPGTIFDPNTGGCVSECPGEISLIPSEHCARGIAPADPLEFRCFAITPRNLPIRERFLLDDQFLTDVQVTLFRFLGICASADKTVSGLGFFPSPLDFGHHMTIWHIFAPQIPEVEVELTDQFGTFTYTVGQATELFVPADKIRIGVSENPSLLDIHWKCYDISGEVIRRSVALQDQFGNSLHSALEPDLLCNPATKTDRNTGEVFPPEEDRHLKCYKLNRPTTTHIRSFFFDQALPDGLLITFASASRLCTEVTKIVIETNPEISKELLDGPDTIGIAQEGATQYTFEITYSGPAAFIVDTVPAEFIILSVSDNDADFAQAGKSGKSATKIEWNVSAGTSTLTVEIETAQSPGHKKSPIWKPTSCGELPLNDGATAFEVDENGELVLVEVVDPETGEITLERVVIVGPSNSLAVEAVEGAKPCNGE